MGGRVPPMRKIPPGGVDFGSAREIPVRQPSQDVTVEKNEWPICGWDLGLRRLQDGTPVPVLILRRPAGKGAQIETLVPFGLDAFTDLASTMQAFIRTLGEDAAADGAELDGEAA